jgi:hypothetical protein
MKLPCALRLMPLYDIALRGTAIPGEFLVELKMSEEI